MLKYLKIDVRGKHIVILGKSNTVGLPMAMLMMKKEATVSVCNADTPEHLEIDIVKHADILISAVGKAHLVKADWVKNGTICFAQSPSSLCYASDERTIYLNYLLRTVSFVAVLR